MAAFEPPLLGSAQAPAAAGWFLSANACSARFTIESFTCLCWLKLPCVIHNQKGSNKCTDELRGNASISINDLHERQEASASSLG